MLTALLSPTTFKAEPLDRFVAGKIATPGRSMRLVHEAAGPVLHDGPDHRVAVDGGHLVLSFDTLVVFHSEGGVRAEIPHDGLQMGDLLHRMAQVEAFTVMHSLDTRQTVAAKLDFVGLPRSAKALTRRIAEDRPEIEARDDTVAIQDAIDRLGEDFLRGDARVLESARAYLIGFGPPSAGAAPDAMIAADPAKPLFLSPDADAAATETLGERLIFAAPELATAPGRRAICIPLGGCGWGEISALTEVRADWLRIDKATGRIEAIVLR
ncbi:hypothetical protein ACEWPM_016840 [Roseovarius sp. S4756]|uniref:hypothetical protein n=1 Tax=Roseovarius maritimus TaxID=3342637 RepID=UPI00372A8257